MDHVTEDVIKIAPLDLLQDEAYKRLDEATRHWHIREGYPKMRWLMAKREFEGIPFHLPEVQSFDPGATYLAARNKDPQLLTVQKLDMELGCVFPVEMAYPYNTGECIEIVLDFD